MLCKTQWRSCLSEIYVSCRYLFLMCSSCCNVPKLCHRDTYARIAFCQLHGFQQLSLLEPCVSLRHIIKVYYVYDGCFSLQSSAKFVDVVTGFVPTIPSGSLVLVASLTGAVVMPHNLFLHSALVKVRCCLLCISKYHLLAVLHTLLLLFLCRTTSWYLRSTCLYISPTFIGIFAVRFENFAYLLSALEI